MALPKINITYALKVAMPAAINAILVAHSTAATNGLAKSIARNEYNTYHSSSNNRTFVTYAVDDTSIYQIGTPGHKVWGAGNINRRAKIQIELCEFSNKSSALKAYRNYIELIATMCSKYGIPRTLDSSSKTSGVKTHNWATKHYGGTTHTDPYGYLESIGISKAQFAADIKAGKADAKVSTTVSKPAAKAKASTSKLAVDGMWGAGTTRRLQQVYGTPVDGVISKPSTVIKAIQRALKVTADGLRGPKTYKAMQKKAGTPADGKLSKVSPMVKYMQRQLNAGKKPF